MPGWSATSSRCSTTRPACPGGSPVRSRIGSTRWHGTATMLWEFRNSGPNPGPTLGSVRQAADGSVLVNWSPGLQPIIEELAPNGTRLMSMHDPRRLVVPHRQVPARRLRRRTSCAPPPAAPRSPCPERYIRGQTPDVTPMDVSLPSTRRSRTVRGRPSSPSRGARGSGGRRTSSGRDRSSPVRRRWRSSAAAGSSSPAGSSRRG